MSKVTFRSLVDRNYERRATPTKSETNPVRDGLPLGLLKSSGLSSPRIRLDMADDAVRTAKKLDMDDLKNVSGDTLLYMLERAAQSTAKEFKGFQVLKKAIERRHVAVMVNQAPKAIQKAEADISALLPDKHKDDGDSDKASEDIPLDKTSKVKWAKMLAQEALSPSAAEAVAKGRAPRLIKRLGSGMEGVADLVSHPEEGLAVRKIYDKLGKWFSPTTFKNKINIQRRAAGDRMSRLYGSDSKGFSTLSEYVKGAKNTLADDMPTAVAGLEGLGKTTPSAVEGSSGLQRYFKDRGLDITDLHSDNIIDGKVIDFLPENMRGSAVGRLSSKVDKDVAIASAVERMLERTPGPSALKRWVVGYAKKRAKTTATKAKTKLGTWLRRGARNPDELYKEYYKAV